jgi:calcium permeable stress-gated cation channel
LKTSNSEFIQKCGLDAYFFLRYLRTLLKIFVPAAFIILPILAPLNAVNGKGTTYAVENADAQATNVTGLDQLAWGNVRPTNTSRYWAHWLLALFLICFVCYVAFDELRGYIRMRQAYLTSPRHRLRASATTVLVSSIPRKWCTIEVLDRLYDVFPGGIRNIWLNRNFDELSEKIQRRDKLALTLEGAETDLIKKCFQANVKEIAAGNKKAGKKLSKVEKSDIEAAKDKKGARNASGHGLSSGNPHQTQHTAQDVVDGTCDSNSESESISDHKDAHQKTTVPIPILGEGIQAVTQGLGKMGKGVFGGLKRTDKDLNKPSDTTNGHLRSEQDPNIVNDDGSNQNRHNARIHLHPTDDAHHAGGRDGGRDPANKLQSPSSLTGTDGGWEHVGVSAHSDDEQRPLGVPSATTPTKATTSALEKPKPKNRLQALKSAFGLSGDGSEPVQYPSAFNDEFEGDAEKAVWRKHIKEKDRDTMRLPIFGWQWMFPLPLIGQKVDTIHYCRKEVARLNAEIEEDQANPDRFPLMNSAFIQFNHQLAAHMACQSVSHHLPKQMAPRLVEIDPQDVVWENMSIPWWQSYLRTAAVISIVAAMIVLWAIPVAFTSALSQISVLAQSFTFLNFLLTLPPWFISAIQGVLPALFLAILMILLPMILRFLAKVQGTQSGMLVELSVQKYYFFFLFVQLFLVVSAAAALSTIFSVFQQGADAFTSIPSILATNVPRASNYFFSYMLLQALSVSAGALVQIGGLISWFVLAPLLDTTARSKFKRQTRLSEIKWGTFFPVYTNLACIGLIYSVIAPLILIFNVITFSLFWFVYRYNTLYVTRFTRDTGGLLYPIAINYTFVGLYVMEVVLIGMFFLVRDDANNAACYGQGVGMIVILLLTAIYQILLNEAFSPLFRYLPITLEDDAVRRDEEFSRAVQRRNGLIEDEVDGEDLEDELQRREHDSREEDREAEQYELKQLEARKQSKSQKEREPYEYQNPEFSMNLDKESKTRQLITKAGQKANTAIHKLPVPTPDHGVSWADRSRNRRSSAFGRTSGSATARPPTSDTFSTSSRHHHTDDRHTRIKSSTRKAFDVANNLNPLLGSEKDMEAQKAARNQLSEALFAGVSDELEDLTPEQRDALVERAFQHTAMRAHRPVIWLPRDELGVSDDEVRRTADFSQNIWISNVRQGLDGKGRCVYSGAPPDFSEVDLIQL